MSNAIPDRNPVADVFSGTVAQFGDLQVLMAHPPDNTQLIASGDLLVRYGIRFLGKLSLSIVPGLLVLDHGEMITGEEAWEFLLKKSNRFPRSEVVGYKNDGTDDMVMIRALDMAVPPEVLVYSDATSSKPIAKPIALITPEIESIPNRLERYLPHYATLDQWQAEMKP